MGLFAFILMRHFQLPFMCFISTWQTQWDTKPLLCYNMAKHGWSITFSYILFYKMKENVLNYPCHLLVAFQRNRVHWFSVVAEMKNRRHKKQCKNNAGGGGVYMTNDKFNPSQRRSHIWHRNVGFCLSVCYAWQDLLAFRMKQSPVTTPISPRITPQTHAAVSATCCSVCTSTSVGKKEKHR